jgi:hypothetical protein
MTIMTVWLRVYYLQLVIPVRSSSSFSILAFYDLFLLFCVLTVSILLFFGGSVVQVWHQSLRSDDVASQGKLGY